VISMRKLDIKDNLPIDYLAHPETDRRLRSFYGVDRERELLDVLGCDFYYLSCRDITQNESCNPIYRGPKLEIRESERVCPLGIRWHRQAYGAKFLADEAIAGPLENASTPKDILDHPWPKAEWFDFDPLTLECEQNKDRAIIGGFWSGIFGDSYRMHGFQNFLLNMAVNPELIRTLVNRMTDLYLELNDRLFTALKGRMDIFFFGNDFGTQGGLIFSRSMWEDYFLENIKRLTSLAHAYGLKVMMHSCGAISELIPLLIEAGVDILDPVQVTARDMEPASLKSRFGDRIIFHGGIDTQQVLPTESPEGVYRHALDTIETLGECGGYIFAPSQTLLPDIPVENIDAMYRAAREYRARVGPKTSKRGKAI